MEYLPDECLISIFEYLPIIDKIRSEAVCKRWQNLIWRSWNCMKELNFSVTLWGSKLRSICIDNVILSKVLLRCGSYLTTIDLGNRYGNFNAKIEPEIVAQICKSCSAIKSLSLGEFFLCSIEDSLDCHQFPCEACKYRLFSMIENLVSTNCCDKLNKFGFNIAELVYEEDDITRLIGAMKNLTSLCVVQYSHRKLYEDFLNYLPLETMQEIILMGFMDLSQECLVTAFTKSGKLRTVCLRDLSYVDECIIQSLKAQCETLENLAICLAKGYNHEGFEFQEITSLARLVNLQKLNLSYARDPDMDTLLLELTKSCKQLTVLDISYCKTVTDAGISYIANLPTIRVLEIEGLENVTGNTIQGITTLEVLNCEDCRKLKDDGLCSFVKQSARLRILKVDFCPLITKKLLNAVVKAITARDNNLTLYLSAHCTKICEGEFEQMPHLLRIERVQPFRPDTILDISNFFPTLYTAGFGENLKKCKYY